MKSLAHHNLRSDRWLLGVASLALFIEVLVLLAQMKVLSFPLSFAPDWQGERIGQVLEKQSNVKSRASDSLTWYPLAKGDPIRLNDTLMTGPQAKARVEIQGEGVVELGPDTFIRFGEEGRGQDLVVNQGVVRVIARRGRVRLRMQSQELSLEPGSSVAVTRAPLETTTQVAVETGTVQVASEDQSTILEAGESVEITELVIPILALDNRYPANGERIFSPGERAVVAPRWLGEEGDELEWGTDAGLESPRRDVASRADGLELEPGEYFWRVRRGPSRSSTYRFVVVPHLTYEPLMPTPGDSVSRLRNMRFQWKEHPEAKAYRWEVSASPTFEEVLRTLTVEDGDLETDPLPPGQYYWRLQASHPKWGPWPVSTAFAFEVRKPLKAPIPTGVKVIPKNKSKSDGRGSWIPRSPATFVFWALGQSAWAQRDPKYLSIDLEFLWEPIKGAQEYRLQIAEDRRFRQMLKRETATDHRVRVRLPRKARYFWRVAGVDEDGEVGRWSSPQEVKPPPPPRARPPRPIVKKPPPPPPPPLRAEGGKIFLPSWVRLGLSGSYLSEKASTANYQATASGTPVGRTHLYLHRTLRTSELELGLWYENLIYQASPPFDAFQPNVNLSRYGGRFLYKGVTPLFAGWDLLLGAEAEKFFSLAPDDTEVLSRHGFGVFPLLVGVGRAKDLGGDWFWLTDGWLELAPWGRATTYGLGVRNRIGAKQWGSLTWELEGTLGARYRYLNAEKKALIQWEARLALVIGGLFDATPNWQVEMPRVSPVASPKK